MVFHDRLSLIPGVHLGRFDCNMFSTEIICTDRNGNTCSFFQAKFVRNCINPGTLACVKSFLSLT